MYEIYLNIYFSPKIYKLHINYLFYIVVGVPMAIRRVQLTGGTTFIVSLPKNWAKKVGLKAGDSMTITELKDGSLKISPPYPRPELRQPRESSIKVSDRMKAETLSRKIISDYLTGYDFVRVVTDKGSLISTSYRNAVRETVHELIGMEIVGQTAGEITIQCLLDYSKLPISNIVKEMHRISVSMQRDAITALLTGNSDLARNVILRDNEVDRLYMLAVKELKDMIRMEEVAKTMGMSSRACLGYRVVVKCIERIADHSGRVAKNAIGLGKVDLPVSIRRYLSEMSERAYEVCMKAVEALLTVNEDGAEEAIQLIRSVEKIEERLIHELLEQPFGTHKIVCSINTIMDSLRRIADYGTDIAEIALNLAAGEPI